MPAEQQRLLDALSSPIRREILWLVWERELAAGDIAAAFEVTAPTISQHLAVLREAGLVEMRVDGNFRRYRARTDAFRGLEALLAHTGRWRRQPGDVEEGADAVQTRVERTAVVRVDIDHDAATTFACLTDPVRYSRWVGVPVTIEDGRFACTTSRGIRVRGVYDVVAPPSLIAMRWDSQGDEVPLPGRERTAYLRVDPTRSGCRVEVHQHAATEVEADELGAFWVTVLARLRSNIDAALAD
jgi:DNA-binding transcriptional ArsR family regulator